MSGRGNAGGVPDLVLPMLVSTGSGQPPTGPDWVVELAWTGHRCIAYVEPGRRTRLLSARNVSMTGAYPELAAPLEERSPPRGMVLDGCVVARGEEHAPRARLLKRRSARNHPSPEQIRAVPVDFQVADLLWLAGHSTAELPYRDRRSLLEGLGFDDAPVWTTSPLPVSELETMLQIADAKGVDALHARHLGGRYKPGGRSPLWVKVPVPRERAVLVGGWTPTDIRRPDSIASLLLGVPDESGLRYVGRVGVAGDQRRQVARLRTLGQDRSPFADPVPAGAAQHASWVRPQLVGLVEFTGWVAGGRLRLPRWLGLIDPSEMDPARWARPPAAPGRVAEEPPPDPPPEPPPGPEAAPVETRPTETRRLEQHFIYNTLNTIGALIRTDPGRARELLFGFADLSRAADQPGDTPSTLGRELAAVRDYLRLEQARFGRRLQVELDLDDGLAGVPVPPMTVLAAVRDAVQQRIEPIPEGGRLEVRSTPTSEGAAVIITAAGGTPVVIALSAP